MQYIGVDKRYALGFHDFPHAKTEYRLKFHSAVHIDNDDVLTVFTV